MTLPKCNCLSTAEQYHLFRYLLFLTSNDAVNWRINCGFVINICCFISNFRPVVNFNYVISPKFAQSRKVFLMSAPCVSKFRSFWSFPTNSTWDLYMRPPIKQIAYKCCINFAKTEFPYRIWCISWYFRCTVLNHWKIQNSGDSQYAINSIRG